MIVLWDAVVVGCDASRDVSYFLFLFWSDSSGIYIYIYTHICIQYSPKFGEKVHEGILINQNLKCTEMGCKISSFEFEVKKVWRLHNTVIFCSVDTKISCPPQIPRIIIKIGRWYFKYFCLYDTHYCVELKLGRLW